MERGLLVDLGLYEVVCVEEWDEEQFSSLKEDTTARKEA